MATKTTDPGRGNGDGDGSSDLHQFVLYKDPKWGKDAEMVKIPVLTLMSNDGFSDLSYTKKQVKGKKIQFQVIQVEDKFGNTYYGAVNVSLE